MSNTFGEKFKITVFGQSHSEKIGVIIEGMPVGFAVDETELQAFMARRTTDKGTTKRKETDKVSIVAGLVDGMTCGAPICMLIDNEDVSSADYREIADKPRPSHADFAAYMKYGGYNDVRGGGQFSGRLTAPICAAGFLAEAVLRKEYGVVIGTHIASIGNVNDELFSNSVDVELCNSLQKATFPVLNEVSGKEMRCLIEKVAAEGDSVGGSIECAVLGVEAGVGEPLFDGVENLVSQAVFAVPGVKAIEFGAGSRLSAMKGSEANDCFAYAEKKVCTKSNRSGGINGGLSNGMPIIFRAYFRPTPSIFIEQETVSLSKAENTTLTIHGRHDACFVTRAGVCIESASAIAILDLLMRK